MVMKFSMAPCSTGGIHTGTTDQNQSGDSLMIENMPVTLSRLV
jgi:hypothetical protein